MASIRDVAKLAEVAPSTVSLVLNNTGYVSETTRTKVRRAMDELNYVPNELARNLYKKRTNMIGVIVPDLSHPFFSTFVRYVEMELHELGYTTMVCSTIQKKNSEQEFINRLKRQMIDGIIMGAHSLALSAYDSVDRPIVALDRQINDKIPIIGADHESGGRLAAELFLKRGCRHVVQAMGAKQVTTPAHKHHFTFEKIMRAGGATVETLEMGWNQFEPEYFHSIANKIFEQYPHADGIFGTDILISCCLQKARQQNIAVPDQLKLIAYDGTYITRMNEHIITAIVQPIDQLAKQSAQTIVSLCREEPFIAPPCLNVTMQKGETA